MKQIITSVVGEPKDPRWFMSLLFFDILFISKTMLAWLPRYRNSDVGEPKPENKAGVVTQSP